MALALAASLLPCPVCERRPSGADGVCGVCLTTLATDERRGVVDGIELLWLGAYDGALARAVRAVKFSGRRALAATIGRRLGAAVERSGWRVGRVAAVPLHPARRRRRGYDQARLLADAAAAELRVPVWLGTRRTRATERQARTSGRRRRANTERAFVSRRMAPVPVVLVDDVWTTGATAGACRDALLAAGAREVRVAVVARAGVLPTDQASTAAVTTPTIPPTSTWG